MTRIELPKHLFKRNEAHVLSHGDFKISTFRYSSGIEALRVTSKRTEIIVLPFKGQQIWRASFDGVDVTMKSMFEEPVDTDVYLETYGAFFIHCGMTAMGAPSPEDTHPLHGELPNAPFQEAYVQLSEDRLVIGGTYQHRVAFTHHYLARSEITLDPSEAAIEVSLDVENRRKTPMDLMYLGHANFRPVAGGELVYSAPYTPQAVRVRTSVPSHIKVPDGYMSFIEKLEAEPSGHHRMDPDLPFDPEVVFSIDMKADAEGWAHALQRHADGSADFISYDAQTCPLAGRWICWMDDQQGLGIAFPTTSGVEGYLAEKAKGRVVELPGHSNWRASMRMGRLDALDTQKMADSIDRIAGRR